MSHTDRLLAIVLELQAHRWRRAEDLAQTMETSKRTIYRDLVTLGQAGVPIISTPGRGYSLVEGYFLPPVSFSTDEATILSLGADVMAQSFDAHYRAAAHSAGAKITAALPERLRDDVEALRERIRMRPGNPELAPAIATNLRTVRGAVIACQRVRFRYFTRYRDAHAPASLKADDEGATLREADPYALLNINSVWYLTAYCHVRKEIRHFRLDRMEDVTPLDQTFKRPSSLRLRPYRPLESRMIEARILFDAQAARWARETPSYFTVAQEDTSDGGLLVTLRVRQEDEITQWLLGWGSRVRVLEPASLREMIAEEAAHILRLYQPD